MDDEKSKKTAGYINQVKEDDLNAAEIESQDLINDDVKDSTQINNNESNEVGIEIEEGREENINDSQANEGEIKNVILEIDIKRLNDKKEENMADSNPKAE